MSTTTNARLSALRRRLVLRQALWKSKKRRHPILGDAYDNEDDYVEESSLGSLGLGEKDKDDEPHETVYSHIRIRPIVREQPKQSGGQNHACHEQPLPMTLGRRKMSQWWWKSCVLCSHVADDSDSDSDSDNETSRKRRKHWKPSTYCSTHCRPLKKQARSLSRAMIHITVKGEVQVVGRKPEMVQIFSEEDDDDNHGDNRKGKRGKRKSSISRDGAALCKIVSIGEEGTKPCMKFQIELVPETKIPGTVTVNKKATTTPSTNAKHGGKKRKEQASPQYSPQSNTTNKKAKTRQHDSMTVSPSPMTNKGWKKRSDKPQHLSNYKVPPVDIDDGPRQSQIPWSPSSVLPPGFSERYHRKNTSETPLAMSPPSINRSDTRKQRPRKLQFSLLDDDNYDNAGDHHQEDAKEDGNSAHPESMSSESMSSDGKPQSQEPNGPKHTTKRRCYIPKGAHPKEQDGHDGLAPPFPRKPFVLPNNSQTSTPSSGPSSEGCHSQPCLLNNNINVAAARAPSDGHIAAELQGCKSPAHPKDKNNCNQNEDAKMATAGREFSAPSAGSSGTSSILSLPCFDQKILSNLTPIVILGNNHGIYQQRHGFSSESTKQMADVQIHQEQLEAWERTASSKGTRALLAMVAEKNKEKRGDGSFWLPALFDDL